VLAFHQVDQSIREERVLALARERLRAKPPEPIQYSAGVTWTPGLGGQGVFEFPFLGRPCRVTYPDGLVTWADSGSPARFTYAALALHYLVRADGHSMADRWIAFRELPDGLMYDRAVRARTEPSLVQAFNAHRERLEPAARKLKGSPISFGDMAFMFSVLPRIRMAIVLNAGDDEFPAAASVLYDGAASHYLATDDLAMLAGILVGQFLKATTP
jgi:hypothetical protein